VLKEQLFFTVIILSLFFSCTDDSSMMMNPVDEYFFFTIDNGSMIPRGTDLPVSFSESSSNSDTIIIILRDSEQKEIALVEVLPEDLKGAGLPLELPRDLKEGLYLLTLQVMGEGLLLSESEVYFYIVGGGYGIDGLDTYPSDIGAGENITARASLTYPEGRDPWIRWTLDDVILKEGFLSDEKESCFFTVPGEEGVFSLKAELFPVKPLPEHHSSAFSHSDLFVTVDGHDPWALLEDMVHTFYVSFSDGLEDIRNPAESPELIGDPEADSGLFGGYVFSSEDGIRYHYNVLPLDESGNVQDFTLSMDFIYEDLPSSGQWRMVTIGNRYSSFVLYYSGLDQAFYAGFSSSVDSLSSVPAALLPQDQAVSLDLVYSSADGKNRIIWFVQNEILMESDISDFIISHSGNTLIGADEEEKGLPLLWQSLGIFEPEETALEVDDDLVPDELSADSNLPAVVEPAILYTRTDEFIPKTLELESLLNEGLSSLEFLLDGDVKEGAWSFSFLDEDGESYFTFDLMGSTETSVSESFYPETLVVSFVNNPEGFFLSHSNVINGPFPYQEYLKFRIVPYNSEDPELDLIKEIRLYQD